MGNYLDYHLTRTQIQILDYAAQGLSDKRIARICLCCEKTIRNHLYTIYHKLDVPNRTAAVVKAHQLELIDVTRPGFEVITRDG